MVGYTTHHCRNTYFDYYTACHCLGIINNLITLLIYCTAYLNLYSNVCFCNILSPDGPKCLFNCSPVIKLPEFQILYGFDLYYSLATE